MNKKHAIWSLAAVLLLVLGALFIFWPTTSDVSSQQSSAQPLPAYSTSSPGSNSFETPLSTPHPFASPGEIALRAISPAPLATLTERSPLADHLNDPQQSIGQDLAIVFDLFEHYRGMYGALPTGEDNAQVVNALAGNNPQRMAFIERSNPALNSKGELQDRWGTPFFFHFISRDALQIRSAGPDREFYTGDDVLKGSPSLAR